MTRYFNTEGLCKPDKHYMVRLDERLTQIKQQYIDRGKYFVINRGRQYGKTTTLRALKEYLMNKEIDESNVFEILNEKQNKRKYVYDTLSVENAVLRYNFKNRTLANKLGEINFEINKFVFPNNDELKYALIEMVSAEKLSMGNIPNFLDNKRREDRTKFVCDKHDIDYIIKQLQEIKEKIS